LRLFGSIDQTRRRKAKRLRRQFRVVI